jgi:hypothetical protein
MDAPRDNEQQADPRVDSRGLPLADRPRSMLAGYVDGELALAGQRAPVDALEAALVQPPRSERRG